jgi:hypothetical protein
MGAETVLTAVEDHAWRNVRTAGGVVGWVAADYLQPVAPADTGGNPDGLSMEPDHQFSFAELWPGIQAAAARFGADPRIVAGVIAQESSWQNLRVHPDQTGHGLIGLDDHGMLPDFERWSGLTIGRGPGSAIIPPGIQIEYLARKLAEYAGRPGGPYDAARA